MRIRLGYVAISLSIEQGSPNKTVTVANLQKLANPADRLSRLRRLARENLANQLRVLRYNAAHDIHLFRFTSKLFPLATHPEADGWDYVGEFAAELWDIGEYARQHGMRVSAHPDHFTILNSPDEQVLSGTLKDLEYHMRLFDAMGFGAEAKLVIHVGGLYKDKTQSLERFCRQFALLPAALRDRLIIENDDRSYTAADVLDLCRIVGAPMVLDVHHHACINEGTDLADLWPSIAATWGNAAPKIHLSSPKEGPNMRAHADYIQLEDFLRFAAVARELGRDVDVMLEAKHKDLALQRLMEELRHQPGVAVIDGSTIEL